MAQPFHDSCHLIHQPEALKGRAARDGYLYLKALLPAADLLAARQEILTVCARHGFLRVETDPEEALAAEGVRYREGDPEYMAAYDEIQQLESFHTLAHQPPLLAVLRALFGEEVLVHPRNIARVMFPQNNRFTTPAHQDYVHIQGTEETYTAWIPLSDCSRELGGLEVLSGSHRFGVLPARSAYGAGGLGVDTDQLLSGSGGGLAWHGGDFRCGDVLLFQSLCVHRGVDNHTPDRVRVSVDYRYQGVSQPLTPGSLLPHFNRMSWEEIYAGWKSDEFEYYWRRYDLRPVEFTQRYHAAARDAGGIPTP